MTTMLVCGGRHFGRVAPDVPPEQFGERTERARMEAFMMREALDHISRERDVRKVISGGQTGADTIAHQWAISKSLQSIVIRAEWKKLGRAAGPVRNLEMINLKPDFVIAFRGGDGTKNMIKIAREHGIEVIDRRDD